MVAHEGNPKLKRMNGYGVAHPPGLFLDYCKEHAVDPTRRQFRKYQSRSGKLYKLVHA